MSLDRTIYGRAHAFLNRLGCAFNAGRAVAIHGAVALAASVPVLAAASDAAINAPAPAHGQTGSTWVSVHTDDFGRIDFVPYPQRREALRRALIAAGLPETGAVMAVFDLEVSRATGWDAEALARCVPSAQMSAENYSGHANRDVDMARVETGLKRLAQDYAKALRRGVLQEQVTPEPTERPSNFDAISWTQSGAFWLEVLKHWRVASQAGPAWSACLSPDPSRRGAEVAEVVRHRREAGDRLIGALQDKVRPQPLGALAAEDRAKIDHILDTIHDLTGDARFSRESLLRQQSALGRWQGHEVLLMPGNVAPAAWTLVESGALNQAMILVGAGFVREQLSRLGSSDADRLDVLSFILAHEAGHLEQAERFWGLGEEAAIGVFERLADEWALQHLAREGWDEDRLRRAYVLTRQVLADAQYRQNRLLDEQTLHGIMAYRDTIESAHTHRWGH